MASKKITAMPNLAGAQVSTDLTTLVDLSVAPAVQNVKSTLNDLFAYLTKNITDKAVRFQGAAAPAVSGANEGAIYYDLAANQFKVSQNGGAYANLINPLAVAGVAGSVQINNGGGLLDGDAQFVYDTLTATVSIGSSALTGKLRLRAVTSGNGITIQPDAPAGNHAYIWPNAIPTTTGQALTATGISGSTITLGWQTATGLPAGSTKQIQFNNAGAFGGAAGFEYDAAAHWTLSQTPASGKAGLLIYEPTSTAPATIAGAPALLQMHLINSTNYWALGYSSNATTAQWANYLGDLGELTFSSADNGSGSFNYLALTLQPTTNYGAWYLHPEGLIGSSVSTTYYGGLAEAANNVFGLLLTNNTPTSGALFPLTWSIAGIQLQPVSALAGGTNELRFLELVANGANYVGFKAPDTIAANKIWTLPATDGTSGQALTTNGSATLSWSTLLSVAGVTGSVQINNGGGLLDGDAQFVYDTLTATVSIGSSALTGKLRLRAVTSGNGIIIQPDAPAGNHTYIWPNALPTTTGQALTATGISGSTITLGWQAAGGTTINSTDEFIPYRLNATTFADSPIRRTGTQTVFITDGVTNFVSLGTGGVQTYQDGSSTFPIINLNSAGGLYVTSTHPAIARAGSAHTVFTAGQTLSVQDGVVTAPSWSFNADANTGIYRSAADTLNIAVGGVNPLEIGTVYVSLISGVTATELRLYEPSGSGTNYTAFKAQAQAANLTYTLPAADGSSNQALLTNGSGTLSWGSPTPGTFADGSAAAPSITFTADTNTGFYRQTAESTGVTAAGTAVASFTSMGLTVGFADTYSYYALHVQPLGDGYPAVRFTSYDSTTQEIFEVVRKVAVNNNVVFKVRSHGEIYGEARPRSSTATSKPYVQIITPADSSITASTQSIGLQLGGDTSQATVTRQWATGALALQQEIVVVAPTYAFAGASTLTLAATFSITGAPKAGTNATLTKTVAAYFSSGAAAAVALLVEGSGTPSANIFEARLTSGSSVFLAATQRETLYLAPIATISSPTNGDVWSDSSRNTLASRIAGQNLFFSSCIFRAIDDKTISNTTTETTLLASSVVGTATIAANHFQPGKVVKLRARGYWNTDAGNSSFNIRFKIGGVTVATGAINATASMTTLPWDVEIEATCRTTGVTGTVMIAGSFNNIQDGTTRAAYKWDLNAGAAGTLDTTGALTVDLTAQMDTATADNFIVCTSLVIELVG